MLDDSMRCIYENVGEKTPLLETLTKTFPSQEKESSQKTVGLKPALEVAIRSVNSLGRVSNKNSKRNLKQKLISNTASNARSANDQPF